MENDIRIANERRHRLRVPDIGNDEFNTFTQHAVEILPPAVHEIVDYAHTEAASGQLSHQLGSNESGAARHQNSLVLH